MHKIITSTLLLSLIHSSALCAESSYSFFGAQSSIIDYADISTSSLGLKYGKQRGMWRTAISLNYSEEQNSKLESFMVQVDQGIFKQSLKKIPLKPYVGLNLGLLQHDNGVKDRGFTYGIDGGVAYILNDSIDLDFCYSKMKTAKINEISSIDNITLSLHYFY